MAEQKKNTREEDWAVSCVARAATLEAFNRSKRTSASEGTGGEEPLPLLPAESLLVCASWIGVGS
jgi:hypothetical protein